MSESSSQVLVVGAGPSGLILALCLAKYGISVRIIDKNQKHRVGRRGAGITPRTLEVYRTLGILDDVLKLASKPVPMRSYELPGGVKPLKTWSMFPTVEPTPACPYLNPVFLGQDQVEAIMRTHLKKYSCEVELGTELTSFTESEAGVQVSLSKKIDEKEITEKADVAWLMGTDGARGVVRKSLNLTFLGETREERFVIGDLIVKGLDSEHIHVWSKGPAATIILWPGEAASHSGNLYSFLTTGTDINREKIVSEPGYLAEFFVTITGRNDIEFKDIVWLSAYTPNIRMADTFGKGRVFIAGDAAHVHSAAGGQGMNSSVQDSFNLGWKLAHVIKGTSPRSLLSTYTEERLPVIAEMLNITTEIYKKIVNSNSTDEQSHWQRNKSLNQLGVNYKWSSIVLHPDSDNPQKDVAAYGSDNREHESVSPGDRAPDAPGIQPCGIEGQAIALFDILSYTCHTILIFSPTVEKVDTLRGYTATLPTGLIQLIGIFSAGDDQSPNGNKISVDRSFIDGSRHVHINYGINLSDFAIIAIRPDGMVGTITSEVDDLQRYFKPILSV
ncbi:hypothetical protein M422DRAFT_245563 [Sphaerobolus stellatus SS14]|nr:hypothetical protein M422DRAFT_245563 [Sphaerobolus stellatus SS14]